MTSSRRSSTPFTETLAGMNSALRELGDLRLEIKALKLFLGRVHPELKTQFPEITKKIKD